MIDPDEADRLMRRVQEHIRVLQEKARRNRDDTARLHAQSEQLAAKKEADRRMLHAWADAGDDAAREALDRLGEIDPWWTRAESERERGHPDDR